MALITKPDMEFIWASGGAVVKPSDVKIQTGWTPEVPPHQWENWIQKRQDEYLAHINQRGIPEWDGNSEYEAAGLSYVQGSNGVVYKSVAASGPSTTVQDPTTDVSDTYWTVAFASTTQASETVQGIVELATTAEAQTGTDDVRAMTALKVKQAIDQFAGGDFLNKAVATVAAAGTINLTTGAPDTSQLAISGTGVTINGFTVAANRFFVVKMTGASNTLVNSASLVTGRGENIVAVSGDTFLMRATAANTVEILCYVSRGIRLGTAQSPLSGTSTDFVGIPPGASRITVMLSGVSTNGGSSIQVQLGSGSIETTGYNGAAEINAASTANTTGLQVNRGQDAASLTTGSATLNRIDGNRWIISGTFWLDNVNRVGYVAGGKTISGGAIDRIRITTANGTDVFDAGQANITWELGG